MTGYVRQSSADIVPTAIVRAAPINNEFNALRDAFDTAVGHKHDGTSAEGHPVPVIGDSDLRNKIATDTVNNRHGVFVEVGGTAVEQVRLQDGVIVPVTNNDIDLGTNALQFKNLYIDGTANIDSLISDTLDVGAATMASADINAGTIDGAVIGAASAQAITGTLITATTNFVGSLTGAVTGSTTGTHTGAVIGNVTGNLTGNVTASTGSSSFNDVIINGNLNMNAGTTATITNLTSPTNTGDAATKGYVDASISSLIDTAPGTLDTLNELAAALNDDPSFATTIATSIATKVSKAGDTMSGVLGMGGNKITNLGTPTASSDAATKTYADTVAALRLALTGGTMSGAIEMGSNKITGLGTPTVDADATTKLYVDGILGSATAAATSAAAAAVSASAASSSAISASSSASNASSSASAALSSLNSFVSQYYGSASADPTLDSLGNAPTTGDLYFNTGSNVMKTYNGASWQVAYNPSAGTYLNDLTAAISSSTLANGNNQIAWNWTQTNASQTGFAIGETTASTGGSGSQVLLKVGTLAGSTADPLQVLTRGADTIRVSRTGGVTITGGGSSGATVASIVTLQGGGATVTQVGNSGGVVITGGGAGPATGNLPVNGGPVVITGGTGSFNGGGTEEGGAGGDVSITGGIGERYRKAGDVNITGGQHARGFSEGRGGSVNIKGGYGAYGANVGGDINIESGQGGSPTKSGNINIKSGFGDYSGDVTISTGVGSNSAKEVGSIYLYTGNIYATDAPTPFGGSNNIDIAVGAGWGTYAGILSIRGGSSRLAQVGNSGGVLIDGGPAGPTASVAGGPIILTAGAGSTTTTGGVGGALSISAGAGGLAATGGNLTLSAGVGGATGVGGAFILNTASANVNIERLRVLANGAWSVGTGGAATGTSGQVLTSTGATTAPTWQDTVSLTGTQTLTNKTLTNPTITNYTETAFTANTSTAITIALTNGTVQNLTLTGSPTITMPTAVAGKSFIMYLRTGTGGFTVTWSTVKWPAGTAPTITSTASRMDIFSFFSDGTNWYGVTVSQNYTP